MADFDWDAPLNTDGRARPAALRAALGLETPELDSFLSILEGELSAEAWGFERLSELEEEQRALVSDQFLSAAYGLQDALTDASVTRREVHEHTGPTGIRYSGKGDSLSDMLRYVQLRRSVAGFFDAVGTALDCLAAILVVATRAPISVQRADFGQLRQLDSDAQHKAFEQDIPQSQRDIWSALSDALAAAESEGPEGWLDWSLEMRNALTHRGRVTNIYLPRRISGQIAVPPNSEPQALFRYDLFLRRRPWLPEIEGMLAANSLPDSVLDEPAGRTVDGLHAALVTFVESLVVWCCECWGSPPSEVIAPVKRWVLPAMPAIAFDGSAPGGTTAVSGAIGGINQEHIRLAERLRVARQDDPKP